jgi:hypothetical protein
MGTTRAFEFNRGAVRVFSDDASPEDARACISPRNANGPATPEAIPEEQGRLATNTITPVRAKHEELGDVEYVGIIAHGRSQRSQRESNGARVACDQKRESPLGFRPIPGSLLYPKRPSGPSSTSGERVVRSIYRQ